MKDAVKWALIPAGICWVVWGVNLVPGLHLEQYGIRPREISGLSGILLAPLIHGGIGHLTANTIPLIVLSVITFFFYQRSSIPVFIIIYIVSGLLVWLFARSAFHIGASSVIYGLATFIVFSGVFRKRLIPILLAFAVALVYGGLFWGIFPLQRGISWEGHLFGALSGILAAYLFRNIGRDEGGKAAL